MIERSLWCACRLTQSRIQGQYDALSYCWSGDPPYKTINSHLNNYTRELAATVFPKRLSNTIQFHCEVGLRYTLIDALCMV